MPAAKEYKYTMPALPYTLKDSLVQEEETAMLQILGHPKDEYTQEAEYRNEKEAKYHKRAGGYGGRKRSRKKQAKKYRKASYKKRAAKKYRKPAAKDYAYAKPAAKDYRYAKPAAKDYRYAKPAAKDYRYA